MPTAKVLAALVDEFGELDQRVALLRPTIERHEKLKKQIAAAFAEEAADESFVAEGERFQAQVSARAKSRRITKPGKIYALLGRQRFVELAKISLEVVDRLIPKSHHAAFLVEDRSGARTVKAVARVLEKAA